MIYPTIVVENFFKDPKLIFDFLKKVKWSRAKDDENWPGVRSESFHKINPELHSFIMNKIISVYYYSLQSKLNLQNMCFSLAICRISCPKCVFAMDFVRCYRPCFGRGCWQALS